MDTGTILSTGVEAIKMAWTYFSTSQGSRMSASLFRDVETYCMFIGYPRSGHSIVGSMLDAHPNAVIAHEMGDLKYVYCRFDRLRLYHLLLQNTRASAKSHRRSGEYIYEVPGQWQGRFERIKVIGDKQGEGATLRLRARPWLLGRLRKTVGVPIRFVHVVRNPYDNISTMAVRAANGGIPDLKASLTRYFKLCETVMHVKQNVDVNEIVEFSHESFIESPSTTLRGLCLSLGLVPSDEYLGACAGIVYKSPHKSRHKVVWSPDLLEEVMRGIERFPFLREYSYEE